MLDSEILSTEQTPFFSIIMPFYNAAEWLSDSIVSIISQSYEDWELICVDDGSSDSGLNIVKEYAAEDARIKVLTQENAGASVARNAGITIAQGRYIMFLDADDFFEATALSIIRDALKIKEADMLTMGLREVHQEVHFKPTESHYYVQFSANKQLRMLTPYTTDKVYKSERIHELSLRFNEFITLSEDYHFWIRFAIQSHSLIHLDNVLYNHRILPGSLSGRYIGRWQTCSLDELKTNLGFFNELADLCDGIQSIKKRRQFRKELLWRGVDFHVRYGIKIRYLKGKRKLDAIKFARIPIGKLMKDLGPADAIDAFMQATKIALQMLKDSFTFRLKRLRRNR